MKFISLLIVIIFIGCDNNQFSDNYVSFLRDSGYEFLDCDVSYNKTEKTYDFTAQVIPKSEDTEMLLARCVNSTCDFEIVQDKKTPNKILCQRLHQLNKFEPEFNINQVLLTYNTKYFLDIKE